VPGRRTTQLAALWAVWYALAVASCGESRGQPLAALDTTGFTVRSEQLVSADGQRLRITFSFLPHSLAVDRIISTTTRTLERFTQWFGPYPFTELTIVDVPWHWRVAPSADHIVVSSRWLTPLHDGSLERALIAAIARRYWAPPVSGSPTAFREGLALYAAARAINAMGIEQTADVQPRHTERSFGGAIPYVVRTLRLPRAARDTRPLIRQFDELQPSTPEAERTMLAVYSLERTIGWPPLQQAVAALFRTQDRGMTPQRVGEILSEQLGVDFTWYFAHAPGVWDSLDYGIVSLTTEPLAQGSGFATRLHVRRFGTPDWNTRSLPVVVAFADGAEASEFWGGPGAELNLEFTTAARAVRASVDPDEILLLDVNRSNNTSVLEPELPPYGARLVAHWMVWLQDLMLTYVALA
jgi:hypothetical protein